MKRTGFALLFGVVLAALIGGTPALAQDSAAAAPPTSDAAQPAPLSEDELEVLVARIALYPDDLVALITSASLYPLQIVEAARYLDRYAKDKSLKPKDGWDGSVVSLLNYPQIVEMMSDDLEWTQSLADAIAYQQKDVLIAIQQLRDEAVAKQVIKSDDKIQVVSQGDNVVIKPTNPEKVYVPQYKPEMLYVEDYPPAPISYYPDPYPNYFYPGATFFAAAVTGAVWASVVDWDNWGVWGGRWNGNDVDIDCNNCFNNRRFNGRVNFNDVDWKNVDRSKIKFDRNQFNNINVNNNLRNRIEANGNTSIKNKAQTLREQRSAAFPNRADAARDIRKNTAAGLKARQGSLGGGNAGLNRPGPAGGEGIRRPDISRPAGNRPNLDRPAGNRPNIAKGDVKRPANLNRPAGKPTMGGRIDNRPRNPGALGSVDRGRVTQIQSNRGRAAMGGGFQGGGGRSMGGGGRGGGGFHGGGGGGRAMRGGGGGRRR